MERTAVEPVQPDTQAPEDDPARAGGQRRLDAGDDEWLRMRTSRLLDLVDPSELAESGPAQQAAAPDQETRAQTTKADDGENRRGETSEDQQSGAPPRQDSAESTLDQIQRTRRLFIRNLSYSASEDDLRQYFESFGTLDEVSHWQFFCVPSLSAPRPTL